MSLINIDTVITTLNKMQEVSEREVYKYMIDDLKIVKEEIESLRLEK